MFRTITYEPDYFFTTDKIKLSESQRNELTENSSVLEEPKIAHDAEEYLQISLGALRTAQEHPANEGVQFNKLYPKYVPYFASLLHRDAIKYYVHSIMGICYPNGYFAPHVDSRIYGTFRQSVVNIVVSPYDPDKWKPLTLYKPDGTTLEVPFCDAYAINTDKVHGFENNEYKRVSVQMSFTCDLNTLYNLEQSNRLFK
jgi:hypothetical protein